VVERCFSYGNQGTFQALAELSASAPETQRGLFSVKVTEWRVSDCEGGLGGPKWAELGPLNG